jgi:hypothetical protein
MEAKEKIDVSLPVWLNILVNQGPTTTALLLLIAVVLGWIPSEMLEKSRANTANINLIRGQMEQMLNLQWTYNEYQNVLLRSICRQIAPLDKQGQCDPLFKGYDERVLKEREDKR